MQSFYINGVAALVWHLATESPLPKFSSDMEEQTVRDVIVLLVRNMRVSRLPMASEGMEDNMLKSAKSTQSSEE